MISAYPPCLLDADGIGGSVRRTVSRRLNRRVIHGSANAVIPLIQAEQRQAVTMDDLIEGGLGDAGQVRALHHPIQRV